MHVINFGGTRNGMFDTSIEIPLVSTHDSITRLRVNRNLGLKSGKFKGMMLRWSKKL